MRDKITRSRMPEISERTLEDERPYLRPEPSSLPWVLGVLALAIAAGVGYYFHSREPAVEVRAPAIAKTDPEAQAPAPAILNPLPAVESAALPTLENSDSMMREAIALLLGRQAFDQLVVADRLIPRIVATVDNLPRRMAPQRMMPLHAVPGGFRASSGEQATLDPSNASRYAAYVRLLDVVPASALVALYVKTYPLFQRAYEQLGFSGKYFNDRVVETIDDLLAAPEVGAPIALTRPKVLYEFADPDLETRSAGQKILLRMGSANARQVKAWLRGVRHELAAAGVPR